MRYLAVIAVVAFALVGCGRGNEKVVTVEVRGTQDIRLLGVKTDVDGIYLALRDARDRDANLDVFDYSLIVWRNVSADESSAVEAQVRQALTNLSMGRRVTVERRRSAASVVLSSPIFWIAAIAGGGFVAWKKKSKR